MNKSPITRTELVLLIAAMVAVVWMAHYWRNNLSDSAIRRREMMDVYNLKREKERNDPPKYLKPEAR
jgi:hypothetical protein